MKKEFQYLFMQSVVSASSCKFIFKNFFICPLMAVLALCHRARAFSACGEWGPVFVAVRWPLTVLASLVAAPGLQSSGSALMTCPAACRVLLDQASNLRPLRWQADSQPPDHQGSPLTKNYFFLNKPVLTFAFQWQRPR